MSQKIFVQVNRVSKTHGRSVLQTVIFYIGLRPAIYLYLQAPKFYLVISYTYGQRVFTKVAQSAKIDVVKQFWRQK